MGGGSYPSASSILFSYADVMKVGGNIFCTQKITTNNKPAGLDTAASSAPPKLFTTDINKDNDDEEMKEEEEEAQ